MSLIWNAEANSHTYLCMFFFVSNSQLYGMEYLLTI
jgi:hypothetical protein